jgi:CRISPR/Cas system CMR-associated protein Cmr5 small subunit
MSNDIKQLGEDDIPNTDLKALEKELNNVKLYNSNELSTLELKVAILLADGKSIKGISGSLNIPQATVKKLKNSKKVKKYISSYLDETSTIIKRNREQLLAQIIDSKLDKLQEDEDLSDLTEKDVVDLAIALDSMQKEREKSELNNDTMQIVNVLNMIKKD